MYKEGTISPRVAVLDTAFLGFYSNRCFKKNTQSKKSVNIINSNVY